MAERPIANQDGVLSVSSALIPNSSHISFPGMARIKVVRGQTRLIDPETGRVHAVVSTEARDREGDIIRQSGWSLDRFRQHPVLLSSHSYGSLRSQIGEWEDLTVRGQKLQGVSRWLATSGGNVAVVASSS